MLVDDWMYHPFIEDGRIVRATVRERLLVLPLERRQRYGVFPEIDDVSTVTMTMRRTPCLGYCPEYQITILGDGSATYIGADYTLIPGQVDVKIESQKVQALIAMFRRADFFSLMDEYRSGVTDGSATELTFQVGDETKVVLDYLGQNVGMPLVVEDIEAAMDRAVEATRWTRGDEQTIAFLSERGFDFASQDGAALLARASLLAPETIVLRLIEAGAATHSPMEDVVGIPRYESNPIQNAVLRGHLYAVRALGESGVFDRSSIDEISEVIDYARQRRNERLLQEVLKYAPRN
ncbi:MAG: hypothetical protein GC206_01775 [Alphaproteobacteria bacterium]|nr:hypothetical protein [Alphaproteobacteria bacterium]